MKKLSWIEFINQESSLEYYKKLANFVEEDSKKYIIHPFHKDIFNALKLCSLDKVKVLCLGQDPYHGPNQAHGLAFSVLPECNIPPSLSNIFKEINTDLVTNHKFSNGCLVPWAQQGVLLLNTSLTVREGQPNSHQNKGWEVFTDKIISLVNSLERSIVFMLWGNSARNKKKLITNSHHLILESSHPSPLSAHCGFLGCKHFSKCNEFLKNNNIQTIDWLF